jgi:hypothetical protein
VDTVWALRDFLRKSRAANAASRIRCLQRAGALGSTIAAWPLGNPNIITVYPNSAKGANRKRLATETPNLTAPSPFFSARLCERERAGLGSLAF